MTEQINEIEEVLPEVAEVAPEPISLRETIMKARDEAIEKTDEPKTAKAPKEAKRVFGSKERDVTGKFLPKESNIEVKEKLIKENVSHETVEHKVKDEPVLVAPPSLNAGMKAKWNELPNEVKQEFVRREQDFHKELTRHDEERVFGKQLREIINPYMPQIRAEGADPVKAVAELLNTAHMLRTATPRQKGELLWRTAQTFGADMSQVQQGNQPQVHPMLQQALQRVESLESRIAREEALKKQTEESGIQEQIKAFSADPKNIHFEIVKAEMAALLSGGLAKDLQDAYDRAVYANPHTRSTLLEQQQAETQEKRVAEQKARAEAARRAGSSVKGSPGIGATKNGRIIQPDLRSELRAQFAAHSQG